MALHDAHQRLCQRQFTAHRLQHRSLRSGVIFVIEAVPYPIGTVLTDNGIEFTFPTRYADGPTVTYTHLR